MFEGKALCGMKLIKEGIYKKKEWEKKEAGKWELMKRSS